MFPAVGVGVGLPVLWCVVVLLVPPQPSHSQHAVAPTHCPLPLPPSPGGR